MSHALPYAVTVGGVSSCGTGSDASEQVNRLLARPVPFADALREMGRPRGWGVIRNWARLCIVKSK
jgi:2-phosphoglycerate kinase